jgi:cytochrome c oxidase subunit 2
MLTPNPRRRFPTSKQGVCVPLVGLRQRVGTGRKSRVLRLTFIAAIAVIVAACSGAATGHPGFEPGYGPNAPAPGFFPLDSVTQQGVPTQTLYLATFIIAVIVFVLVEGLLLFITLRFRRKSTDTELPPQIHGSSKLELLWTIIPMITVTALFIAAIVTLNEQYDAHVENPDLTIDVTGFQWQWTFDYKDQGISLTGTGRDGPVMAVPVGEKVHIRLHATDVIHSFYVPQFLYKKDVIPGRTNEFDVVVQQVGTYAGQCAEFCGIGHADMHFTVQAMAPADFDAWVTQQQAPPPSPSSLPSNAPSVSVTSVGILEGFDPNELSIPADTPWSVTLTNADADVPHNFSIHSANPDGSDWDAPVNADGGGSAVYQPPPLKAGDYTFFCSLHANMTGTLHVGQ